MNDSWSWVSVYLQLKIYLKFTDCMVLVWRKEVAFRSACLRARFHSPQVDKRTRGSLLDWNILDCRRTRASLRRIRRCQRMFGLIRCTRIRKDRRIRNHLKSQISILQLTKLTVKIAANNIRTANCRVDVALVNVLAAVDAVAFEASVANAFCIQHLNLS